MTGHYVYLNAPPLRSLLSRTPRPPGPLEHPGNQKDPPAAPHRRLKCEGGHTVLTPYDPKMRRFGAHGHLFISVDT